MAYKIKNNGLEVKTKDGKNIMGSDFHVDIKELDTKSRTFVAIASTENPDRSNDIVRVDGWDLKNYKKAPRGLWAHDYHSVPIFKSLQTTIDKKTKQLIFKPEFDVFEFANIVFNQYQNGFMSDFSVGFIGKEHKYRDEENMWGGGIEFLKQELLEISAVPVPDNPEAQKLGISTNDIATLISLGYQPEFHFDEQKGIFWNPISKNLEAYNEPKLITLGNGIKAVQALPIFLKEATPEVVGYYFDSSEFNEEKVKEWLYANVKVAPAVKYFLLSLDEEKINLDVSEDKIENKEPDNVASKDDDTDDDANLDDEKCAGCNKPKKECECVCDKCNKLLRECGCDKPKMPKSYISCVINYLDAEGNIIESKTWTPDEISLIDQKFDKQNTASVDLISQLRKELDEVKTKLAEVVKAKTVETVPTKENDDDDSIEKTYELDLSELPPVSPENKGSKEYEIDSLESLNNLASDAVNAVLIDETFKSLFDSILAKNKITVE